MCPALRGCATTSFTWSRCPAWGLGRRGDRVWGQVRGRVYSGSSGHAAIQQCCSWSVARLIPVGASSDCACEVRHTHRRVSDAILSTIRGPQLCVEVRSLISALEPAWGGAAPSGAAEAAAARAAGYDSDGPTACAEYRQSAT